MLDDELTDQVHHACVPNLTLKGTPVGLYMFRTEPDPEDPNSSTLDNWCLAQVRGS